MLAKFWGRHMRLWKVEQMGNFRVVPETGNTHECSWSAVHLNIMHINKCMQHCNDFCFSSHSSEKDFSDCILRNS